MVFSNFVRQHWAAFRALLVLTVIVGIGYPLFIWLVAQIPGLKDKADGSIVDVGGKPVASSLIGQLFTDSDGNVAARAWDLDDDGSYDDGTGTTASRAFAAAGTYTVRLRATDDDGATNATSRSVTVVAPPPPPPPASNLLSNPSFEVNTSGWAGYQATLAREAQAGAPAGGFVAKVTRSSGTFFTIDDGARVAGRATGAACATGADAAVETRASTR